MICSQLWIWMLYLMNYVIKQVMILRSNARNERNAIKSGIVFAEKF